MRTKSRCELMLNPSRKREVDAEAAAIAANFPRGLARPALRALRAAGIRTLNDLRGVSERELAALHGVGPKAVKALRTELARQGISFRKR